MDKARLFRQMKTAVVTDLRPTPSHKVPPARFEPCLLLSGTRPYGLSLARRCLEYKNARVALHSLCRAIPGASVPYLTTGRHSLQRPLGRRRRDVRSAASSLPRP